MWKVASTGTPILYLIYDLETRGDEDCWCERRRCGPIAIGSSTGVWSYAEMMQLARGAEKVEGQMSKRMGRFFILVRR